MFKIIYTAADGRACIVHPAAKKIVQKTAGSLTDEEYKKIVWDKSIPPNAINPIEISADYVFPSREFRDAWVQNGKEITYNLEKARNIQLERIRVARKPKLEALDVEYQIADEKNDLEAKRLIAQEKQVLRDITNPLKSMQLNSIEDVKIAFPEMLKI